MNRIPLLIDAWPEEVKLPCALAQQSADYVLSAVTVSREKETAEEKSAAAVMECVLRKSEDPAGLIILGSCTNAAVLLHACPELKQKIAWVSIAGGSFRGGDVSAAAERNIFSDPEAAGVLLHSGLKIYMTSMETEDAVPEELCRMILRDSGSLLSSSGRTRAVRRCIACLAGMDPSLFEIVPRYVDVESAGRFTRGATVIDRRSLWKKQPNVHVIEGIRIEALKEKIQSLRTAGREAVL